MLRLCLVLALAAADARRRSTSTPTARGSTCGSSSRSVRGRRGRRRSSRRASTSRASSRPAGVAVAEQKWVDDTPAGKVPMVNLIATIPGARKDRIVFAGHYDTKRFPQFRFVGASDGGSSAAFVLELARVLKARRNPFTIELLFLDGEEAVNEVWAGTDNTYGSRHYVETAKRDGSLAGLKALVLLDMIGDRNLQIRRDSNSTPWLTELVWSAARRQKLDTYFIAGVDPGRGRPRALHEGRRAVGGHHRPRLPAVAHRRRTRSTPSAPAACRSSATSSSPRSRTSKRASSRPR